MDYDDVTATLEREGVEKFSDSFAELLDGSAPVGVPKLVDERGCRGYVGKLGRSSGARPHGRQHEPTRAAAGGTRLHLEGR